MAVPLHKRVNERVLPRVPANITPTLEKIMILQAENKRLRRDNLRSANALRWILGTLGALLGYLSLIGGSAGDDYGLLTPGRDFVRDKICGEQPTRTTFLPTASRSDPEATKYFGNLIPTARPIYHALPPPLQNFTLAQFGWILRDPYDALNADWERVYHMVNATKREEYMNEFLLKPWKSELCDEERGIVHPEVCVRAKAYFRLKEKELLNEKGVERVRSMVRHAEKRNEE